VVFTMSCWLALSLALCLASLWILLLSLLLIAFRILRWFFIGRFHGVAPQGLFNDYLINTLNVAYCINLQSEECSASLCYTFMCCDTIIDQSEKGKTAIKNSFLVRS